MHQQECFDNCPSGYFKDDQRYICVTCNIPFCLECLSNTKCKTCEKGFLLSQSKTECTFSLNDESSYAYFNFNQNEIVEVQKCPEDLEQNEEQHICTYPKICSQENYIGELNSNCFNKDEDGIKILIERYYLYFYTKKEVYVFTKDRFTYQFYLQSLNSDQDIQTVIGFNNYIYIVYSNTILIYHNAYYTLEETIQVPVWVQNNQFTQIIGDNSNFQYEYNWLITSSASLQDILVFNLKDVNTVKFQYKIGQKIFEYFIIPESNKLIVISLLKITIYSTFMDESEPLSQLDIGEQMQVDWIKSYSYPLNKGNQDKQFVVLNGLSVNIFDSENNSMVHIVAPSNYGYVLEQNNILSIIYSSKIYFLRIKDLIQNCLSNLNCLNNYQNLVLYTIQIQSNEYYIVSEFNNDIYVAIKDSFQLQVFDQNFNLKYIKSDFKKPIKSIFYYQSDIQIYGDSNFLIVSYDNNARIFLENNQEAYLFNFCNENSIEIFNEEIEEYGAVGIDEQRRILINAAISTKGNLVIFMIYNGQALFQKEFQGDDSFIQIFDKTSLELNQQVGVQIADFYFEFLDTTTILIISPGKFIKFDVERVSFNELQQDENKITGKIYKYQIEQKQTWMLIQELRESRFIFHFINLLSNPISHVGEEIIPLVTQDDKQFTPYLQNYQCSFLLFPQSSYNQGTFFQIISSEYYFSKLEIYQNTIVTYKVFSSKKIKLIGKKRILQLQEAEKLQIVEGQFSQNQLQFMNQINIKEQISILCSFQCYYSGKIDKYQLLYKRWQIPNIIKQLSTDRIYLDDYYQNTMYSDKWHVIGLEAYLNSDKKPLDNKRIDLIQYPEKQVIFSYKIKVECSLFTFQIISTYDTLLICDDMNILVYSLYDIIVSQTKKFEGTAKADYKSPDYIYSFKMEYPQKVDKFAYFSQIDPYVFLNLYGIYDFLQNKFFNQPELLIYNNKQQTKIQIMENKTHLYYIFRLKIYFYEKQKSIQQQNSNLSKDSSLFFLNQKDGFLNLERDFIIGLTQLNDQQYVQIVSYQNLTPIKLFYEFDSESFNTNGFYFYCWQYQKLFLRYENSIVGYDYPFSENQQPFFVFKVKKSVPRACSNSFLVTYEQLSSSNNFKITIIEYENQSILKDITLNTDLERINIDLFINQTNVAIIEDKQIVVIGNILISTSKSDFYYIFQESKFHYSPSLDLAFIHQQSIEKYLQVLDLSQIFPFVLERFSFENKLNFQNYYFQKSQQQRTSSQKGENQVKQQAQVQNFQEQDLIFINLNLNSLCVYNIYEQYYTILKLPNMVETQNLQALKIRKMQYLVYLNKSSSNSVAVIKFDREFYLYRRNKYLKTLNLYEYQEIYADGQDDLVYIYAFKDKELYYLTIDNDILEFKNQLINLSQFNFQNFLLIDIKPNVKYALIDINYNLIAQNSIDDSPCLLKLPSEFFGQVKGIQIVKTENNAQVIEYIFLWIKNILNVYNFQCELIWSKNNIDDGIQVITEDNLTQQIYFADKYYIYIIQYQDLLIKQYQNNIIVAQLPLQARSHVKLQKLNKNLLAVLSASNIYIFEVYKSFTLMYYITNKDFFNIQQVFYVLEEYFVISDINRMYIYQIITDDNPNEIDIISKSVNRISGSSSYSSSSSINSSYQSNQGDNSEYYSQKQFFQRKLAVPFYEQTNLYLQILEIQTFTQEEAVFIRIVGADYNNLVDLTKQLIFNHQTKQEKGSLLKTELKDQKVSFLKNILQNDQKQSQNTCRGKFIIHQKKDYQIIQYDTIYSQNDGLYNQINFKFPSKENNLSLDKSDDNKDDLNELFIPNSLKLKTKLASYFIYDLSDTAVLLFPLNIKSSVINKLKIMNGKIEANKGFFRLIQSEENTKESDKNKQETIDSPFITPNSLEQFKFIHLENVELRQSLNIFNCESVILKDIFVPYDNPSLQIQLQFYNVSSLSIKNLTVHSTMLSKQFLSIINSQQVDISYLNVFDDSSQSYIFPQFSLYLSFGWITIQQTPNVTISNINFTGVNANIDLFFLQYVEEVYLENLIFQNLNSQFNEEEEDFSDKKGNAPSQSDPGTQININERGEIISQDQQMLNFYAHLPVNIENFSSVFRLVFIQKQLSIKNILLEESNVSMFLHLNKTINFISTSNSNINEQFESTQLDVQIVNVTINQLSQIQQSICYQTDFLIIDAESVTIDTLNIYSTSCFQSIIRLLNTKQTNVKNVNIIKANLINFLFYFFKNQNLVIENFTVQENNQLNQIFGIIKCFNSLLQNIQVYPYVINKRNKKEQTLVKIKNSAILIYNNQDDPTLVSKSSATIIDSQIQSLQSINSNGTAIQVFEVALKLQNVKLFNNSAGLNGGAIYLYSSSLTLTNTLIQYNNATFSGGAIFSTDSIIKIEDSLTDLKQKTLIQYNFAAIGGGIRYFRQNIDQVLSVEGCLKHNRAIYFGQDYTNYPTKLIVKDSKPNNTLQNVVSSISSTQQEIKFYWVDEQNQKLKYTSQEISLKNNKYQPIQRELNQYTTLYMSSESIWINRVKTETEVKGEIVQDIYGYQYIKTNQNYLLKPKSYGKLKVKTMINYPEDEGSKFKQNELLINIFFRECVIGEIFNPFNQDVFECLECKDNMYSLIQPTSFENKCLVCPDNAKKCYKNVIEIFENYWIEPNTTNIYFCFNNPDKCQPELKNGCSQGGYGPRCESCDYTGQVWKGYSYTRYGIYECKECGKEQISYYVFVCLFIILFPLFFTYLAYQVTIEAQAILQAYYLKKAGIINIGLLCENIRFIYHKKGYNIQIYQDFNVLLVLYGIPKSCVIIHQHTIL
ncbi:ABC transporter family protein (macronuclear) [Tetrahymena thermophila SB210]|uniref:ABC transporter family protein n=1 Tax=Tetrahymena thermophila (strain SB210) TaxID=312017 RepID=I7M770_TETTS|nr:ABC transporter family protein [Tetrahymena thermophila SB210]EAR89968.2 ABC transporter family protein [Tetrahymena thermophila SB210]|eukprot:XP_001010213.2 ABC transporter family protein [Tetrahymena thermophila SB210]